MNNSNVHSPHIAVIGGGAAGIIAAITAARKGARVTILERQKRIGRKILATGNGRCNLTNTFCSAKNYHGETPEFVAPVLRQFNVEKTLKFFQSLGVATTVENEDRVFPITGQASTIVDVLRYELDRCSVTVKVNSGVESIRRHGESFIIKWPEGEERADRVIATMGGRAMPPLGGTATGIALLKELGHAVEPVFPALVPLKTDPHFGPRVKGVKIFGNASLTIAGRKHASDEGEIHFADYGLSGPPVIQLSEHAGRALRNKHAVTLNVDFFPWWKKQELLADLRKRFAARPKMPTDRAMIGLIHKRLIPVVLREAGMAEIGKPAGTVLSAEIVSIADQLKKWPFTITGSLSWRDAQVMGGGIRTADFDPETLESHHMKGLFAAGEILDVTGDCGGFNLQWAWSSGYVAGLHAASALLQ